MSATWKISGFALLLLLVSFACVVELRAYEQSQRDVTCDGDECQRSSEVNSTRHKEVWKACLGSRCFLASLALAAMVTLELVALRPRKVPVVKIGNILINNFPSTIKATHELCSQPSTLFVVTFAIFAIPNCLTMVIEVTCEIIERDAKSDWEAHSTNMIIWRALLFTFTILQTRLAFKYVNRSIQLRLGPSWMLLSIVMATNIAVWFSTIGLEVQGINGAEKVIPKGSYCEKNTVGHFNDLLYPFQIEYCVMGSLMAFTMMSNLGRLAKSLQDQQFGDPNLVEEKIKALLHSPDSGGTNDRHLSSDMETVRQHSLIFIAQLLLLLISVAGVAFVRFDDPNNAVRGIVFETILLLLYICGLLGLLILWCYVRNDGRRQIEATHFADRLLLWLGAAAILLNSLHRIWGNLFTITLDNHVVMATNATVQEYFMISLSEPTATRWKLKIVNGFLNIFQSAAQTALLEWILISRFSNTCRRGICEIADPTEGANQTQDDRISHKIRALLNLLMTINGAEWILSALCFTFFFPGDQKDAVSLLLLPLHVFYRFHSAVCVHDFKRHLKMKVTEPGPEPVLVADFDRATSRVITDTARDGGDVRQPDSTIP